MGEKTFFLGQICKIVMGFGHPIAMIKNLNGHLSLIHKSIDIRVSLDDEHLVVYFACTLKCSMSFHDFHCVWQLVANTY
jgi:hypothetical protein